MSACGQFTDKKLPLSALGCGSRSFDVAFISAVVYFKKKKARSLAGSVMKRQGGLYRGGWSEVWALHVAINGPRGLDL